MLALSLLSLPGTVDGIRQLRVVNIAAANPDFPIILQWTGGRAGERNDIHQSILAIYCSIHPVLALSPVLVSALQMLWSATYAR